IQQELKRLKRTWVRLDGKLPFLKNGEGSQSLYRLLKRPEFSYKKLAAVDPERPRLPEKVIEEVEIEVRYEGYIKRQLAQVERLKRLEDKRIPEDLNYGKVKNLSSEGREKLSRVRPLTLGQAARVPGIPQADLAILMVYLKSRGSIV
ncbi:MAG: tRNA uridine-5-carboxymethylaminomethyl(34) synthesis enzyme MnmG, partial [Candidatus Bipolaricaulia bacterium]